MQLGGLRVYVRKHFRKTERPAGIQARELFSAPASADMALFWTGGGAEGHIEDFCHSVLSGL